MDRHSGKEVYLHPTHDELSRQAFIIKFKQKVNFNLQDKIKDHFNNKIKDDLELEIKESLDDLNREHRKFVKDKLSEEYLFKAWSSLTWISQGMMWNCVEDTIDHDLPRLNKLASEVLDKNDAKGSILLKDNFTPPSNIAKVEIHRQPGGFCYERDNEDFDIMAGARYTGGSMVYGAGKGRTANAGYPPTPYLIEILEKEFGEQKPKRILDIGCGTGLTTISYAKHFPESEVYGIDVAKGLLRWGHIKAESEGIPVHFVQMNSSEMDFEDESFDLVVSTIWGHETTPTILKNSIAEIWRILKPGGISFHVDVPNQAGYQGLVDQVLNDWQIRNNGEPFWMGWADSDLSKLMDLAGYPKESQITGYRARPFGTGEWFVHGAKKHN